MTVELYYLTLSAGLAAILWIPLHNGAFCRLGHRSDPELPGKSPWTPAWAQRSQRAHLNLLEYLASFRVLVISAHLLDVSTGNTVLGQRFSSGHGLYMWLFSPWAYPTSELWHSLPVGWERYWFSWRFCNECKGWCSTEHPTEGVKILDKLLVY